MDLTQPHEPGTLHDPHGRSGVEYYGNHEERLALSDVHDGSASCLHDAAVSLRAVICTLLGQEDGQKYFTTLAREPAHYYDAWAAVQPLVRAAGYGKYGIIPDSLFGEDLMSVAGRRAAVAACIQQAHVALTTSPGILAPYWNVWRRVVAREALDFGGHLSVTDLALLADTSEPEVEEEISRGVIAVDAHNRIPVTTARAWLYGRPGFRSSRWQDPTEPWNIQQHKTGASQRGRRKKSATAADLARVPR